MDEENEVRPILEGKDYSNLDRKYKKNGTKRTLDMPDIEEWAKINEEEKTKTKVETNDSYKFDEMNKDKRETRTLNCKNNVLKKMEEGREIKPSSDHNDNDKSTEIDVDKGMGTNLDDNDNEKRDKTDKETETLNGETEKKSSLDNKHNCNSAHLNEVKGTKCALDDDNSNDADEGKWIKDYSEDSLSEGEIRSTLSEGEIRSEDDTSRSCDSPLNLAFENVGNPMRLLIYKDPSRILNTRAAKEDGDLILEKVDMKPKTDTKGKLAEYTEKLQRNDSVGITPNDEEDEYEEQIDLIYHTQASSCNKRLLALLERDLYLSETSKSSCSSFHSSSTKYEMWTSRNFGNLKEEKGTKRALDDDNGNDRDKAKRIKQYPEDSLSEGEMRSELSEGQIRSEDETSMSCNSPPNLTFENVDNPMRLLPYEYPSTFVNTVAANENCDLILKNNNTKPKMITKKELAEYAENLQRNASVGIISNDEEDEYEEEIDLIYHTQAYPSNKRLETLLERDLNLSETSTSSSSNSSSSSSTESETSTSSSDEDAGEELIHH